VITIPNIRSAVKRQRQNEKRRRLNRARKRALKTAVKQIKTNIAAGDKEAARSHIPQLSKAVDKAALHHTIHKNKASRIKSRLIKRVESM